MKLIVLTDANFLFEECPKWAGLKEVLREIQEHNKESEDPKEDAPSRGANPVLVCAADDRSCNQLREVRSQKCQSWSWFYPPFQTA